MPRKADRFTMPPLGEWYADMLRVDAFLSGRTDGIQASSLLCAKLQEEEAQIKERIGYLARKRGIHPDEMWAQIVKGEAEVLEPEEISDLYAAIPDGDRPQLDD